MAEPEAGHPDWETAYEGDVLVTNLRDGDGSLRVQVMNDMLVPVRHPYKPDPDHEIPMGHKSAADMPLQCGLWRKVYDGKTGWRRD